MSHVRTVAMVSKHWYIIGMKALVYHWYEGIGTSMV